MSLLCCVKRQHNTHIHVSGIREITEIRLTVRGQETVQSDGLMKECVCVLTINNFCFSLVINMYKYNT